ncbi:protein FAR1-RELATED SEQUENCE 6-like [Zingiber officinale]|uniref:protein FAR1-RELATED SEQUENCE 6-like n=1 Tax=Zingiber officinale TaxID=94328 RepID=UPI001C4DCC5A|nr:protein FAR1-RELATED SEQUENCE 6-like [Zingiber officinale]
MEQGKSDSNEVNDNNENVHQDLSPSSLNEVMIPKIGMTFLSEDEVRNFYKSYAQNVGFGIFKLGGKKGDDEKQKYFCFGCAKSGKTVSQAKNVMYPRPSTKTNCKAKINVVIRNDDNFVISSVSLEHNHVLSPGKSRHFRCNKLLDSTTKRKLELNDQAGITLSKSFHSLVVEAGGYENLSFDERKCRNFISEARRLRLGDGDVEALSNYFCRMQSRNSNFFYVLDLDEESRIRNIFWADARCRAAYDYFSDVVTFDTTYLTNSYDMPFAPFDGVNHHGQSILLGCGLLSSEDSETFIWLFKSWLTCMLGRAPKAIITDQCRAMAIAIEEIFPNSHHRLCLWHIMKKLPAKLGGHAQYKMIKKQLKNIVYNSLTVDECDERWMTMIEDFNLENNDWLKFLYEQRNEWISVYVKDKFWAERHRYNILTPLIQEVPQLGANNDDSCSILVKILKDAKEKLIAIQTDHSRADQLKEASTSSSKTIHSRLKVRSRGRPPTKRKQSKIEQIVKKSVAKARKKVIEGPTVSVEELNNMENGKHDSLVHSDAEKRFED